MIRRRRLNSAGFTLTEIIVAIAILSIVLALIVIILGQMAVVLARVRGRDVAVSLAQQTIEDLRSTLNIPDYHQDTPRTDYLRTVSSTFARSPTGNIIPYLRTATVVVQGPSSTVTLATLIQTYRPSVNFSFPIQALSYTVSPTSTRLIGSVFTQTGTIASTNVKYRLRTNGGAWNPDWTPITTGLYTNLECTVTAPIDLQPNVKYYFYYDFKGVAPDGTYRDLQFQATDSNGYYNFQPAEPEAGSSWVRLVTDDTKPTISAITVTASKLFATTPTLSFVPPVTQAEVTASDGGAGIYRVFYVVAKTATGATSTPSFWNEGIQSKDNTPYYNFGELQLNGLWIYPPSLRTDIQQSFTISPTAPDGGFQADILPGDTLAIRAHAIDNVIGRRWDYLTRIPPPLYRALPWIGLDPLDPWKDINANYASTPTLTLIAVGTPSTPTSWASDITSSTAVLNALVNPNGLSTSAWFEVGTSTPSATTTTPSSVTSSHFVFAPLSFSQSITVTSSTTYYYRVLAGNPAGTSSPGEWLSFQTPAPTPPTTFTLSGRVTKTDSSGLDGVTLSLSDGGSSVVTAIDGTYSITVLSGWSGQLTPSYSNGSFNPISRSYTNVSANQSGQDFLWTLP
jgi:prepilin-type N-terminal cleavage/methylation domain-containing protein